MEKSSAWEEAYRDVESLWGLKPDYKLAEYADLVPKGKVLDLGIGEGRNALFFAKKGYEVEGFDMSQTAVDRCIERAKSSNLKLSAKVTDLKEVTLPKEEYSLIIAAWMLNFLKKAEAERIALEMKKGLKREGIVYVGTFSMHNPGYEKASKNLEVIEESTFYSRKRDLLVHYFTREELLSIFTDFKTIYCAEGMGLDLSHDEPHYHGFIEYIGQKRG